MATEPASQPPATGRAENAGFSVDTHLFRELGELLVGRDSTALVELVKNSYDADATRVLVHGERLADVDGGRIVVSDDGTGMTVAEFRNGFLRVAARTKSGGERRSKRFGRRFTGEKGIGRLAAHKLSRQIDVRTVPWSSNGRARVRGVLASIDWDALERHESLDDVGDAVSVRSFTAGADAQTGTEISLAKLRRPWGDDELSRFLAEAASFESFPVLTQALPRALASGRLLFAEPNVRDIANPDPGFAVEFSGEFEAGGEMWDEMLESVEWVVEIRSTKQSIRYAIAPTPQERERRGGQSATYTLSQPDPEAGPFFDARLLVRERRQGSNEFRVWSREVSGVRVFMEGFRVLPYGEPGNDWLRLDRDYTSRSRAFAAIEGIDEFADPNVDQQAGLTILPNDSFIGGVFLTDSGAPMLQMLVNREGFVPNPSFELLERHVRAGADLLMRARAAARLAEREARRQQRKPERDGSSDGTPAVVQRREELKTAVARAQEAAVSARRAVASGAYADAEKAIALLEVELTDLTETLAEFVTEQGILPVLASVGIQMAQFTHEINGLVGLAQSADQALERIRGQTGLSRHLRAELSEARRIVSELRSRLERQASYLIDVITPDARRRRSRLSLAERFDAAARLIEGAASDRGVRIRNEIPAELKSPPMYPAELTAVFANLISNAVKAAGKGGRIVATGDRDEEGRVRVELANTGIAVSVDDSERWFRPFESTTIAVDPVLGQGMGLGLPITRALLEEYGATIRFVTPRRGFASAVEIAFRPS
jgi:signal transduction histidine kinase